MKKDDVKNQNIFLDIYIIVATIVLIFAIFVSNYALIDNFTFKPFQHIKIVKNVCDVSTDTEDIKISYLVGDNVTVFSEEDKIKILKILYSLELHPTKIKSKESKPELGILILDNLKEKEYIKLGFNKKHLYICSSEYNFSNSFCYDELKEIINKYM